MGITLVTGHAGEAHVSSQNMGAFNAGAVGPGMYVLDTGTKFQADILSNTRVKISDGDLVMNGRHASIRKNDSTELTIANGSASSKRNDLIVCRYTKAADGTESTALVVIKGTAGSTAVDPAYNTGNILNGDATVDFPLYRVKLDGLSIDAIETMYTLLKPMSAHHNLYYGTTAPTNDIGQDGDIYIQY